MQENRKIHSTTKIVRIGPRQFERVSISIEVEGSADYDTEHSIVDEILEIQASLTTTTTKKPKKKKPTTTNPNQTRIPTDDEDLFNYPTTRASASSAKSVKPKTTKPVTKTTPKVAIRSIATPSKNAMTLTKYNKLVIFICWIKLLI